MKGATGKFIRSILVPAGQATMLSLLNPENKRMASIAFNTASFSGQDTSSADTRRVWFGYGKLVLSKLSEEVRKKLSTALGCDVLKLKDLLISSKAIDKITYSASSSVSALSLSDTDDLNVNGFQCLTDEGDENVVTYDVELGDTQNTENAWFYYTPDG